MIRMEETLLKTITTPVGAEVVLDGRTYVNFGGASYLGLSGKPELLDAGVRALRKSGAGAQFARHYHVATPSHRDVEIAAAEFFGTEGAIYLSGGYYFGHVSMAAKRNTHTVAFFDDWCHFSLRDGITTSGLPSHSFRHLDVDDFRKKLKDHMGPRDRPLVVTDGMYSTFGEIAPLAQLAEAVAPYRGLLLVDESHSFGVLGESGRGAYEHHGLPLSSVLFGGSTGKGLGVLGGIIPASLDDVAAFRATPVARGASAGMPASAAMCAASLRYIRSHPQLLSRLRHNVSYLKGELRKLGLEVGDTVAPVVAFVIGSAASMQSLREKLFSEGISILYSTYIGAGAEGVLRCGIFADHTKEHLDRLVEALRRSL